MPVWPQDSRRRGVDSVAQKGGSRFHAKGAPDWTRRPATRWSRLTNNLFFAGILAMAGWLIFASVEPSPGDPAMATEESVEQFLIIIMRQRSLYSDLKKVPESRRRHAIEKFKRGSLYDHIFRQASR